MARVTVACERKHAYCLANRTWWRVKAFRSSDPDKHQVSVMWASKIAAASPPHPVTLLLAFTNYQADSTVEQPMHPKRQPIYPRRYQTVKLTLREERSIGYVRFERGFSRGVALVEGV